MTKPWLRLYRNALHKPKVGRLALDEIGFWAACLMLSDDAGNLPSLDDIGWQLRLNPIATDTYMRALTDNALVTRYVTNGVTKHRLHDWDEHQRKSDADNSGSERQRKWRERQKEQKSANVTPITKRNALRNRPVTLPDTDTDTEDKKELTTFVPKKTERKGDRWPADAVVPDEWVNAGYDARERAKLSSMNLQTQAVIFQNYWSSKSGAAATKLDWKKTWINWCLNAKGTANDGTQKPSRAGSTFGAILTQLADHQKKFQSE